MSMINEGFQGRLDVGMRKREILPALLSNALFAEDELHIPLQLHFNEDLPLVISFYEYYRFLDRLIETVLQENIARLVLVRVKMPAVIALPPSLLDPRVAIFYDLAAESEELIARGTDHLCVDANFKLYSWSAGDNKFSIRWISPTGNRLNNAALAKISDVISTLPAMFEYSINPNVGEH
ncbi:MAG: hypothetical protein LBQ20_03705 [Rhodanobacter sp.]|jgi:hypothetical protein|nr:hypothetical protein [Rhodanobacter sp.]